MPPEAQITSDSDLDVVIEEFRIRQVRRDSTGPKYSCSISGCDASFKRLDHLDRHEYHHTGIKKHACSYDGCDKSYSIVTHLKRHIRSAHESPAALQKTIKCSLTECDKMFTSVSNMQRHVREAHECPREYACGHCPAKFRQKMKLRRHEITQHTQEYPYRCEKCARGFYQHWQQESHQRCCKIYTCPQCDLKFDKWTLYTKHCRETLHGRERHKCKLCERTYDKVSELKAHITAKHPVNKEPTYRCTEPGCNRSYLYERNLRQHVLSAHTGRRFECLAVGCHRCFSSAQNLSKHMLRNHKVKEPPLVEKLDSKNSSTAESKASRKRRRDAGIPARSCLSKLACVVLDKKMDKEVRLREPLALSSVADNLQKEQTLLDDGEMEEMLAYTLQEDDGIVV